MPAYDYECPQHGVFEDWHLMKDHQPTMPCPVCQEPCHTLVAAPGIGLCDTRWIKGNWNNKDFESQPVNGEMIQQEAKRQGVSLAGKRFNHAIADHPKDLEACVGSLSEAMEAGRRKGYDVSIKDGEVCFRGESHFHRKNREKKEKMDKMRKERLEAK